MDHKSLVAVNEAMVEVLKSISRQRGVPFVDLRHKMNGKIEYFRDHVHLDPKGSRKLSDLLASELMKKGSGVLFE